MSAGHRVTGQEVLGGEPAASGRPPELPARGATVEVEVTAVAHGGHCVARHEGRVLFVRHALPGERVLARITEDTGGSFARADAVDVLRAAPERVAAPCPEAGPGRCGGCDFQHVSPAGQRELKATVVREQLARLGGLPDVEVTVQPLPGGALGWRTRMQFAVDRRGRAGLRRHRSHAVRPLTDCPLASADLDVPAVLARRWRDADGVDVVGGGLTGAGPDAEAAEPTVLRRGVRRDQVVTGPPRRWERAAGRTWRVGAESFWQVHPAAADTLAAAVLDLLSPVAGERAVDLYGGVGLFAGVLAEAVGPTGSVVCVENDRGAVADAVANLAGTSWAHVRRAAVEPALVRGLPAYDVAVVDPPRSGLGRPLTEALAAGPARAVAYVACDPAALARDVRTFTDHGWTLDVLRAYDLFPMTHHVECVALLVNGRTPG